MPIDPRRIELIEEQVAEIYRRMAPSERVARGLQFGQECRRIVECAVRARHPDWSEVQIEAEVRRRRFGD